MIALICWSAFLISDKKKLRNGLIRFHVVAHSDSQEDQAIKLTVRDAVLQSIQNDLQEVADIQEAKEYLLNNLPKIQQIVHKICHITYQKQIDHCGNADLVFINYD